MSTEDELKNEEIKNSKTGEEPLVPKGTTEETVEETPSVEKAQGQKEMAKETPESTSKKKYYDQAHKSELSKENLWKRLKTIITVFAWLIGICIAVLGIFYGYKINSISEPIGGIKENIRHLENSYEDLKTKSENLQEALNETREEFIKKDQDKQTKL